MAVTILMGSIVLQVYAEPLFKEAVPTMNPNTCSILLAVTYVFAGLLSAFMMDKFGRKVSQFLVYSYEGVFFSFPRSGNNTKRGVKFHYSTCKISKIENSVTPDFTYLLWYM